MAEATFIVTDFRGGFWSPSSQGRMGDPEYKRGLNECLNGMPLEGGAWVRRPPFRMAGYTRFGQPARLLSLASLTKNYYNMEVSRGHLRFLHGPQFVTDATQRIVTNISPGYPAVITTEADHGWVTGDTVIFDIRGAAVEEYASMTSRVFAVEKISATTFAIHDLLTDKGFDGTIALWASTFEAYVSKIADVTTPYVNETWQSVKRLQTDKNTLLLHSAFPMQSLTYDEASSSTWANIELAPAKLKDGPYLDPVSGSTVTPTGLKGIISLVFGFEDYAADEAYDEGDFVTSGGFHWKSLQTSNIGNTPTDGSAWWARTSALSFLPKKSFSSTDVGRHIRLFSEPPLWAAATVYANGDKVKHNNAYWMAIDAATGAGANEPGSGVTKWVPYAQGARWTWGKIVGNGSGGTVINPAGLTKIGNLTGGGSIAHLFDGYTNTQLDTASAQHFGTSAYGGMTLGAPTAVASARVWPSRSAASVVIPKTTQLVLGNPIIITGTIVNPFSNGNFVGTYTFQRGGAANVTFNLRAKATAPSSASDGTLLGTSGTVPYTAVSSSPINIVSNDATTLWSYVWIEMIGNSASGPNSTMTLCASEMEFFSAGVQGNGIQVQIYGDPLLYSTLISTWRLGMFNDTDPTYPTCGCFHQGRIWLGVGKNRFVASKAGDDHFDFAPTEPDGTVTDASAITYKFNSEVNAPILWMHPGDDGIVLGIAGGERLIFSTTQNQAITPTNINCDLKTSYGSSDIEPVQAPLTSLFVHANGRDVHEYMRDASSGRYIAPPLTEYAKSLSDTGIVQITYQRGLTSFLWACTADGRLIGTTYERDYLPFRSTSPPAYNGWHHHSHGAPRDFVSVSVGPSIDGSPVEALAVITKDRETGYYRVEVQADLMPEDNDIFDCNFLDGMYVPASGGTFGIASDGSDSVPVPPTPPAPGVPQWRLTGWHLTAQCTPTAEVTGHVGVPGLTASPAVPSEPGVYITPPCVGAFGGLCGFQNFWVTGSTPGYDVNLPTAGATSFVIAQHFATSLGTTGFFPYQYWDRDVGSSAPWGIPTFS